MKSTPLERVREISERVAASGGLELVDAQILGGGRHRVVRLYIDRLNGVTHTDCETVSHEVGTLLDAEEVIPGGAYTLEVSSPGIERPLLRPSDYERFVGQKVKIQLREPIEKRKKFDGTLTAFDGQLVTLETDPGKTMVLAFGDIEKANLKYEWK